MTKRSPDEALVEPRYRTQFEAARSCSLAFGSPRLGFSLLEVIIATAVLAGSAMVLISLIGSGSRYGVKAEELTIAVTAAQSVLDEYLIDGSVQEDSGEKTGVVDGSQQFGFRLTVSDFEKGNDSTSANGRPGLVRITVEIFDSQQTSTSGTGRPLCRLTRWIRQRSRPSSDASENFERNSLKGPADE